MKRKFNKKGLIKKIIICVISVYVFSIFVSQQKTINSYENTKVYYAKQIEQATQEQQKLTETKNNINSKSYIEKMAREKLDMYLPNERVYIDKNNR